MVTIRWCKEKGLRAVTPSANVASSYLRMAGRSLAELETIVTDLWTVTITYYVFYYALYAVMARIGITSSIHACSIAFMKGFLDSSYSKRDIVMLEKAFKARIDLQYYSDRPVNPRIISTLKEHCRHFLYKSKDILSALTETDINAIRERFGRS